MQVLVVKSPLYEGSYRYMQQVVMFYRVSYIYTMKVMSIRQSESHAISLSEESAISHFVTLFLSILPFLLQSHKYY